MKKEILSSIGQYYEMAKKRPAIDLKGQLILKGTQHEN